MQISSRFTIALHIFACVETFKDDCKVTSDFLASSINTNPVIIRKILSQLKNAGLIRVARGTGGITVTRPLKEIRFYDVYQAIEPVENGDLFHFHENPNPSCPVGRNIHALLDDKLRAIQCAMEDEMKRYTLADLHDGMQERLALEAKEKSMTQEERLDYLVSAFKADSGDYADLPVPEDTEGKRRILRSLMNIRMPRGMAEETVQVQDAYLTERAAERGVVALSDIPTAAESVHSRSPFAGILSVWKGDITRLGVDAIVNAANSQMLGCFVPMHACIDNCIHSFAGIQLRAECSRQMDRLRRRYGRSYEQPTAVPMLTDGYNLPAKKVIHIVGPIVEGRLTPALEGQLADCYRNTLDMCASNGLRSVAFCCISTGVFHFPRKRAAEIAVDTVSAWLGEHEGAMDRVIFNVFNDEDQRYYEQKLR